MTALRKQGLLSPKTSTHSRGRRLPSTTVSSPRQLSAGPDTIATTASTLPSTIGSTAAAAAAMALPKQAYDDDRVSNWGYAVSAELVILLTVEVVE